MIDIKRYDISYSERYGFDKEEDPNGEYVEWEDHAAAIAAKDARIAELEKLRAQPARQVGGDEREAFETWQIESGRTDPMWLAPEHFDDANNEYAFLDVQQDWAIWKACCAALAPAAKEGE